MAIDLEIPELVKPVTMKFKIPSNVAQEFALYVKAAKEGNNGVDRDIVLQAILEKTMKKDRGFRTWLKSRKKRDVDAGAKTSNEKGAPPTVQ